MLRPALFAFALLAGTTAAQATTVVATDAAFADTAQALAQVFHAQTGETLRISQSHEGADLYLAPDAPTLERMIQTGAALAESRLTYAMGLTGTEAATQPRDAALLRHGQDNPTALNFLDFLLSPEAWDVIVSHGFGAH